MLLQCNNILITVCYYITALIVIGKSYYRLNKNDVVLFEREENIQSLFRSSKLVFVRSHYIHCQDVKFILIKQVVKNDHFVTMDGIKIEVPVENETTGALPPIFNF